MRTISSARRFATVALTLACALSLTACASTPEPATEQTTNASASPAPTGSTNTTAAADSAEPSEAAASAIVEKMTLEEKVAQLFFVTPEQLTGIGQVVAAGESTRQAYAQMPVGGVIYFEQNLLDAAQTRAMLTDMQNIATDISGLPAFLAVDEEGGSVVRIGGRSGFDVPNVGNMRAIGDSGDTVKARDTAAHIGAYLADLGFNVDFAPVADIANTASTTMSARAFGSTEEAVTPMVAAQLDGFRQAGILPCVKHFPGIGGALGDSHTNAISTAETIDEMKVEELKPFEAAIEADVPFIMVGHLTVTEATGSNLPASLNPVVMSDLLRNDLGYDGLIITDSLAMGAVTKFYAANDVGLQALRAGADMVLIPLDLHGAYQRILDAVAAGEMSEERIDESALRVVRAKLAL